VHDAEPVDRSVDHQSCTEAGERERLGLGEVDQEAHG